MATISIDGNNLTVEVQGADKLWTLNSRLTIPLKHVRGATADPGMANEPKGFRGPGTHLPGVIVAGTFHQDGQRIFWDVHDQSRAVVIELQDDTSRGWSSRSRTRGPPSSSSRAASLSAEIDPVPRADPLAGGVRSRRPRRRVRSGRAAAAALQAAGGEGVAAQAVDVRVPERGQPGGVPAR